MMKKYLYIFTLILITSGLQAQKAGGPEGAALLKAVPGEKIFVHYNASLLFPGEYLYYKIYNLNSTSNTPSAISKVGYVELVGENGEQVFQHMVPLEQGQGHGDFFIPTTLPSGNYKLLAYTQWMRNQQELFAADLVVLNPYLGDQAAVTPEGELLDPSELYYEPSEHIISSRGTQASPITLQPDRKLYQPREKVSLILEKDRGLSGQFSVSVRRLDSIRTPSKPAPELYNRRSATLGTNSQVYLPEFRGDLISGRIVPLASAESRPLRYVKVAFSIPGEQILYKVATTNKEGEFFINFDEPRSSPELFLQIIGDDRDFFEIRLDEVPPEDTSDLKFANFLITPEMEQWILDRSVQNQIENAYYNQKPDTVITSRVDSPFYVKKPELYLLDAFNRFQSIEETFVEIIQSAWISKNRNGENRIVVREPNGGSNFGLPALLLVDGVMVQDHTTFISYPAKNVESIGILRDNFYIGSHIFEGIVDVRTFSGRYWQENPEKYLLQKELKIPEPQKLYFQQSYTDGNIIRNSSLPDLRTQLLWKPEVLLSEEETTLDFYTSDVPGDYEIELNGFSSTGKPVVIREYFRVRE